MRKFLGADTVEPWISDSFPYFQSSMVILIAIASIIMIIAILVSPPNTGQGSNAITGASESYYTKNKGANNQGRIRNVIIICASIIAVAAVLYLISYGIYQGS